MTNTSDLPGQRSSTNLQDRQELLTFKLIDDQLFGIPINRIQEIVQLPEVSQMPGQSEYIIGCAYLRGMTIPVVNLSQAIGFEPLAEREKASLIITEFNNSLQGFLVSTVDRIISKDKKDIDEPPSGVGFAHYLESVCEVNNKLLCVIDVEKVLLEISGEDFFMKEPAVKQEFNKYEAA